MTMRGRCNNLGLCENATRQRTIDVPEAEPFVCPKCETELTPVAAMKSTRSAASVTLPLVVISLALAGAGYKVWDLYGRPAASGSAQTVAQAEPQTNAAVTPPAASATMPAPAVAPAPPIPAVQQTATAAPPAAAQADPGTTISAGQELAAAATAPAVATSPVPQAAATAPAPAALTPAALTPAALTPAALAPAALAPAPTLVPAPVQEAAAPAAATGPAPVQDTAAPPNSAQVTPVVAMVADPSQRVHAFLGGATRVPITFTFRSSVVALTGRSEHDVERLVSYLKEHHATGNRLYLAGFTDNQGDAASNDAVSQKRVAAVAAALAEAGMTPTHVASFGADMPVADNATQGGRDRNRRVEVYLAPEGKPSS